MKDVKNEAENALWGKVANVHEEKKNLLRLSEISLILDTYDDIFSDFDPRPFSERTISDDFLLEARRASRDLPSGKIELKFLIPQKQRNIGSENLIRKRLRDYFIRHHQIMQEEMRKTLFRTALMAVLGVVFIMVSTYLRGLGSTSFSMRFLTTLLEPAGWFTTWTGLDEWYYTFTEKKKEHLFFEKMSRAEIIFLPF